MDESSPDKLMRALERLGAYLDTVEAGLIPVCARKYQLAARTAEMLIGTNLKHGALSQVVSASPALLELRSNFGMAKAIHLGLFEPIHSDPPSEHPKAPRH